MPISEIIALVFFVLGLQWILYRAFSKPSLHRGWIPLHSKTPCFATSDDGYVVAHNVRSARYRTETDYDVSYSDKTFRISDLAKVWFAVEPYSIGQAHTFLSFEFDDNTVLVVSVEVRKTAQEDFRGWKVSLRNYEIFYVLSDEQDVLHLRTNIRKDPVMLYPLHFSREEAHKVLESVIGEVNSFHDKPAFYRIWGRNCTSVPMNHLRAGKPSIPRVSPAYIITSESDRVLYNAGLIDHDVPLREVRKRYAVTEKAQASACDESFSRRIRG